MRLPWRKKARLIEPKPMVCLNFQELQTAKEILAEVFHARPSDVEEMIQRRLEEKNSISFSTGKIGLDMGSGWSKNNARYTYLNVHLANFQLIPQKDFWQTSHSIHSSSSLDRPADCGQLILMRLIPTIQNLDRKRRGFE